MSALENALRHIEWLRQELQKAQRRIEILEMPNRLPQIMCYNDELVEDIAKERDELKAKLAAYEQEPNDV